MPIKCHNRVLLLLAFVAFAAVALPFVNVAPNRLMSGEGKALWQVWSFTPAWLVASLSAWVILSLWQGRPAQWLTLLLSEGLFILLFWSAGLAATHMASAESPLARTTIGSGLWLWLALCLLACSDAIRRLIASAVWRWVLHAQISLKLLLKIRRQPFFCPAGDPGQPVFSVKKAVKHLAPLIFVGRVPRK